MNPPRLPGTQNDQMKKSVGTKGAHGQTHCRTKKCASIFRKPPGRAKKAGDQWNANFGKYPAPTILQCPPWEGKCKERQELLSD
jgi:hypothetical protein